MQIKILNTSVKPMFDFLLKYKQTGQRDETELRKILNHEDYKIEFLRYGLEDLPICNITYEDSVYFFMNFDKEDFINFDNKRLQYKLDYFKDFFNNLEERYEYYQKYCMLNDNDLNNVLELLRAGMPDDLLSKIDEYNILFTISIGNSFGWPYENYIDFDIANFTLIKSKDDFIHILAHEIYHTFFDDLISENMKPDEYFLLNFAFEGIAMHYMNNAKTLYKPSKYSYPEYSVDITSWDIYNNDFDFLFSNFKKDYLQTSKLDENDQTSFEVTNNLISSYQQFYYTDSSNNKLKISQYPTYYLGCHLFGAIDIVFGKEILLNVLKNPNKIVEYYNKAMETLGYNKYFL